MIRFNDIGLWEVLKYPHNPAPGLLVGLDSLFDDFVVQINVYCQEEKDMAERTRSLNYLRSRIVSYAEGTIRGPKMHRCIGLLARQAISFIDSEINLVRMQLEYPECFCPDSPFDFAPRAQWNGTLAQLLEIIVALAPSGLIRTLDGRQMNLVEIAGLFEEIFGLKISDLYGRKTRLLTRKKNESPFLDNLLFLYRKEVEKMSL